MLTNALCPHCGDWDYFQVPPSFWGVLLNNYPIKACPCGNCPTSPSGRPVPPTGYLVPVKLTFPWLITGLLFTIHNRMGGYWNKGETETYLKQCGLNSKIHGKLEVFTSQTDISNIRPGDIFILQQIMPASLKRNIPIEHYIDAPCIY
jgi:hypothetical protein